MEQIKKKEYNFIFDSTLLYLIVMLKTWLASAILRKSFNPKTLPTLPSLCAQL